jgi:hypothetical protein
MRKEKEAWENSCLSPVLNNEVESVGVEERLQGY